MIAKRRETRRLRACVVAVAAGLTAAAAQAGTSGDAVTISLSGSTAMRNFTIDPGFSQLNPGSSITLNSGPGGSEITYSALAGATTNVQLAAGDFGSITAAPAPGSSAVASASYAALRIEWHEQGSVEGILELADSQINDQIYSNSIYNPTSGNATYVNRNRFGGAGATVVFPPATLAGHFLDLHPGDPATRNAAAQSRVQMAISDVAAPQGFSRGGSAAGAFNLAPGQVGYGKGNPALPAAANLSGVGLAGARQQLQDETALNMAAGAADPTTGGTYAAGPWNSAGAGNLHNETVAITATTFSANPGTGLTHLNRTDAQWLQAAGRLANGADFNVATRDVGSGTRNVAANNAGLDPSFAVGENDAGNGNASDGGTTQVSIGPGLTFSNKTAGGGQLRPTLQNARMALGHLSLSDAIGSIKNNASSRPLRALDYRDDANDASDGSNAALQGGFADPASNTFVRVTAQNIVSGSYVIYQNETYVTVKQPSAASAGLSASQWAALSDNPVTGTGIKGDNSGHDVYDFRQNILGSVANFPASSVANPADALVQKSFILPQFMQVAKAQDGLNRSAANPGYDAGLSTAFLSAPSLTQNFNAADPAGITTGQNARYGDVTPATGAIAISSANFLFGNFNQNGIRDFSAIKAAQAAQAALFASGHGVDMFSGDANSSKVAGLSAPLAAMAGQTGAFDGSGVAITSPGASKGDLVVLGDFNGDGRFDGKDLYSMARGAALADSTATDQLTAASGPTLGDMLRNGVLRKNAALDYLQASATPQQKLDATASAASDPAGANAFNKFDVNRDGKINRSDAQIVDAFVGKDYRSLADQLMAVVATNVNPAGTAFPGNPLTDAATPRKSISLVDVELNDTGDITHVGAGSDTSLIISQLLASGTMVAGDANFDGIVGQADFGILAENWAGTGRKWSTGDFNFDGVVGQADFGILAENWQGSAPLASLLASSPLVGVAVVPEPGSASLLGLGLLGLLRRRRRA